MPLFSPMPSTVFDAVDFFDRHIGEMRDAYVRLSRENDRLRKRELELMSEVERLRSDRPVSR